ncbi:MAG: zinc metallopeptidase [Eggerthellaceae bacterium]|nr:zinc metallopeptidase [Eggerthellaceae bacterium]
MVMSSGIFYIVLMVVTLALGLGTQGYIQRMYSKFSKVKINLNATGAQIARKMLNDNGLANVEVRCVDGTLSDHYDPRTRVVNLSRAVFTGSDVSSLAVSCHECGHAIQHATNYSPLMIRTAIVPIANFSSNIWIILLICGFMFDAIGLVYAAIACFGFAVLFQIVTLPVEFNASKRGLAYIESGCNSSWIPSSEVLAGSKKVLTAAAMTYVAAALISIIQLLYYIGMARNR